MQRSLMPIMRDQIITKRQNVWDILKQIKRAIKDSAISAKPIAMQLKGMNKMQTLKNVYNFAKQIPYHKEPESNQTARTLPRILYGFINGIGGDCKHYTIVIASLLKALGIPFKLRLISQNYFDSDPTHIYVVAYVDNKEIYLDCVMKRFNDEPQYKYKYDTKA